MVMFQTLKTALDNDRFVIVVAGLFGLCIGSFLNVVIARVPAGMSIVTPASRCPRCGTGIRWYDNLPVISWVLILRGKCRECGWPIPFRYPLVEIMGGMIAVTVVSQKAGVWPVATGLFAGWILLAVTMIDLDHKIIPDSLSMPGFAIILGTSWLPGRGGVVSAFLGAALGAGIFWLVREAYYRSMSREGLGLGDVKLMAMIGALLGPFGVCVSVFAASFIGILVAGFLMVMGKVGRRTEIPFGPYLAAGGFVVFLGSGKIELMVRDLLAGFWRSIL